MRMECGVSTGVSSGGGTMSAEIGGRLRHRLL